MQQYSDTVWTLKQNPTGPLAIHLDVFAAHLESLGFCRRYIGGQLRVVANFSRWLRIRKISTRKLRNKHIVDFLSAENQSKAISGGKYAALNRLITFLHDRDICVRPVLKKKQTQTQIIVEDFGQYLVDERYLSPKTRIQYCPIITRFLTKRFKLRTTDLAQISAADIIDFIRREADQCSIARAKVATNAMRAFIRYGIHRCGVAPNLSGATPSVASWSMTDIPKAISPTDVQAILSACSRNTPIGQRDYAILLLLARLGLRAGEIVALTLDNIDWGAGSIFVVGKFGKSTVLPLPEDVGEAISNYLLHGRPCVQDRTLFLRSIAPIRPLGAQQTIATVVNAAIKRAGVSPPTRGAHQFRHALATDLLTQGASLAEIGRILRHQHSKTTNIYTKVDIKALRELSIPWPGGAL